MIEKLQKKRVITSYTLVFLLVGLFAFFWLLVGRKTLVHVDDGFDQWYPLLVHLKRVCAGLFSGNGVASWSWTAGLGGDLIGNYYSVFLDPFSYFAAAFPTRFLDI